MSRNQAMAIDPRLIKFISTRDKRLASKGKGHNDHQLLDLFHALLRDGEVNVGGRSSNGYDSSWDVYINFIQIVNKANSLGYTIEVDKVNVVNKWSAGGYWQESKFLLITRS